MITHPMPCLEIAQPSQSRANSQTASPSNSYIMEPIKYINYSIRAAVYKARGALSARCHLQAAPAARPVFSICDMIQPPISLLIQLCSCHDLESKYSLFTTHQYKELSRYLGHK
jgi:hypothetical protein